eukprot:389865_1
MEVENKQSNDIEYKHDDNKHKEDPSERIKRYLSEKKSIRFATIEGISFLRYCIAMIDEELAIEIIKNGIDLDINEPWDNGQSPLHFAAQMDMIELIKIIFKYKSNEIDFYSITDDFLVQFNDFQPGGKTILHYSAINGNINICKLLIEFENNILKTNKLLFIKDFENNTAIDNAIMYRKYNVAKYLLSLQKTNIINNNCDIFDDDLWIKNKENELIKKRLQDSKSTRMRFEKENKDLIVIQNDLLNKVFTINNLWNVEKCAKILNEVIKYGNINGWTTSRHRSYATTDIPSYMIGYNIDEYIRKLLYDTLYPQIIEKYKLNERFNVNNNEYFEIGVKDLFFVKYDLLMQNELKLHRDGSLISFNILLNNKNDFEGGGTYIKHINKVIEINKGDCVMHSGKVLHAGHPITKGQRFILVGFLDGKVRKKFDK